MDQKVAWDIFTRYQIAFAPARKSYRIGFLFTHKNSDLRRSFCNGAKLRHADP